MIMLPNTYQIGADIGVACDRRRNAWKRSEPLACGCRDPWSAAHSRHCEPQPSEGAVDGWRVAAEHLLEHGLTPLVPLEIQRRLWKRGGTDRVLVLRLERAA